MLIRHDVLEKIRAGDVTLQFRKWKRPTVKAAGTLLTKIGQLAIEAVEAVEEAAIDDEQARSAGYADADALRSGLAAREGDLYKVQLRRIGDDPRAALRAQIPEGAELDALKDKVEAFDRRSKRGPWAVAAMRAIATRPATRAGDLATAAGMERKDFKSRVRKLKALGLTESLAIGYQLSPRGAAVLRALEG